MHKITIQLIVDGILELMKYDNRVAFLKDHSGCNVENRHDYLHGSGFSL